MERNHTFVHDIPDHCIGCAEKQVAQSHGAHQRPLIIQHITDINGLTVHSHLADPVYGLRHRLVFLQIHILHRHDTAGRILRITHQMVDGFPRVRTGIGDQAFNHIGGHFLHQLLSVIRHHIVDDAPCILVGQRGDDRLLLVDLQIRKNVRRLILGQNAEYLDHFLLLHLLQIIGDIGIVQFFYNLS